VTTYRAILEYDGTRYSGWQEQKNARTVLGEFRKAAQEVFRKEIEMQGAGRTDAGVHALAQVLHIKVRSEVRDQVHTLKRKLNELLPADIAVLDLERVPSSFHARHDAISRVYMYQLSTRKQAFLKRYVWWVKEELNLDRMSRAAALLVGRHDFVCFRALDDSRPDESTIVVVESAELEHEDDIIQFRIEASHFLWRMVRRIVGALVKVGTGELSEDKFRELLDGRNDSGVDIAAWTAPAAGLFIEHVRYADSRRTK
jgi:tRNA pseudouridine38-40 synthase